eukprot:3907841-Pyramimonas_sp.AAC.1
MASVKRGANPPWALATWRGAESRAERAAWTAVAFLTPFEQYPDKWWGGGKEACNKCRKTLRRWWSQRAAKRSGCLGSLMSESMSFFQMIFGLAPRRPSRMSWLVKLQSPISARPAHFW